MTGLDLDDLRQGDILRGGRVFFQTGQMPCLIKPKRRLRLLSSDNAKKRIHQWVMPARSSDLAVLTQSCDIRKLESITFAPVTLLEQGLRPEQWGMVRQQRITYYYYIPAGLGPDGVLCPECYVDARITCTVDKDVVRSFSTAQRLGLPQREQFRKFLLNHFARPAVEDEILVVLRPFIKEVTASKTHGLLQSVWINVNRKPIQTLVVFSDYAPAADLKLTKAIELANNSQSDHVFALTCKSEENTTLSDLRGFVRLSLDYLSLGRDPSYVSGDLDG